MTTMYTADVIRALEEQTIMSLEQQKAAEAAALDAIDLMLAAREGLGDSLIQHLTRLRDAITSYDALAVLRELRDLLNHLLGEEGFGAQASGSWLTLVMQLVPIVLELIKQWRTR